MFVPCAKIVGRMRILMSFGHAQAVCVIGAAYGTFGASWYSRDTVYLSRLRRRRFDSRRSRATIRHSGSDVAA